MQDLVDMEDVFYDTESIEPDEASQLALQPVGWTAAEQSWFDYDEGLVFDQDPTMWDLGYTQCPSTMRIRKYQYESIFNKMIVYKRYLNRDRPGMGKTMQAAFAAEALEANKVLIVAPSYLTGQWYEWLKGTDDKSLERNEGSVIPNVSGAVRWCRGPRAKRESGLRSNKWRWYIINQEMLQSYKDILIELKDKWDVVIFDEAHHLRNHQAERSKTAKRLATNKRAVFTLTATPIWKEVDDLFMQFSLLHPVEFPSYIQFVDLYCLAEHDRYGTKVLGVKQSMTGELKEMLGLMSIGRTYEEVGRQLPPVIPIPLKIEFPDDLRKAYDEVVDYWRTELFGEDVKFTNFSQVLNALRQFTFFPGKLEAVKEFIDEDAKTGKVVVFTWYKDHCYEAAKQLGGVAITGDILDPEERRRIAKDPRNRIVCATISSLSEGVDLSMARTVIFLEEHWPPGSNDQALSRVQRERVGNNADNSEPIKVYYAHVPNSIDTVIHRRAQRRAGVQADLGLRMKDVLMEALGI